MNIRSNYNIFLKTVVLAVILSLFSIPDADAHEPIFGIGPRTIWQYGVGVEAGLNIQHYTRQALYEMDYHAIYGLTADWAVSFSMHQPISGHHADGLTFGDIGISSKYRFYRNDIAGAVYHAAILGGVEVPTGDHKISTNTTDVFAGLSVAYEGRRWLLFATGRYRINTNVNGIERGDAFLYDLALGIRPILADYYDPDLVLMAELNGQVLGANRTNGKVTTSPGGGRLFAGFGAWITYRNWAVKPGLQVPVYNNVGRESPVPRFTFAVEFHL